MHNDANVFTDPLRFDPERWLKNEGVKELENQFVPFSRGPRMCLGFKCVLSDHQPLPIIFDIICSLAWCELYLIFANVFRKLDLEIYETTCEPEFLHFRI